jgi:23S rRNA pseudouridine2604 synthase
MEFPIRINKYLADKGYATRKGADALVTAGRVLINGAQATLGQKVHERDTVSVSGEAKPVKHRYVLYYKPAGILTHAEKGSGTEDLLAYAQKKNKLTGLFPIGRLDKGTEGLIVLTDDGRLTRRLVGYETFLEQEYDVVTDKRVTQTFLNRIEKGVRLGAHTTSPAHATASKTNERQFTIAFSADRAHHIRRMCDALGYAVVSLKRTRIGSLSLRGLKPGAFHELSSKEVNALSKQLGLR